MSPAFGPGMPLRILSVWQPWATLMAIGAKRIETRSWSTPYRGWVALHAAKTPDGIYSLAGDCEGNEESGWRYGYIGGVLQPGALEIEGGYQACYCYRTSDEGTRGTATLTKSSTGGTDPEYDGLLPLGAVVAVGRLTHCLPIISDTDIRPMIDPYLVDDGYQLRTWGANDDSTPGFVDVTTDRPYGDYRSGRFGWLFEDVTPLPEPLPWRGQQGLAAAGAELQDALQLTGASS